MLQPDDLALPVDDARVWADERGIPFLTERNSLKH